MRAGQCVDILGDGITVASLIIACNLVDRMNDRGVVPAAEPATDIRQGPCRQGLGQIHGDMTRTNHGLGAALGTDIRVGVTPKCVATAF